MRVTKHAEAILSPTSVTREEVKTLAIAVGVREAARQLGLAETRVLQWSKRGEWFKPTPQPPRQSDVITVISPSDALRTTLTERSNKTKLGLSKAAMRAAEHFGEQDPEWLITEKAAMSAKHWAATASTVHGWEAGGKDTGPFSPQSIQILSQRTYLNMGKALPGSE